MVKLVIDLIRLAEINKASKKTSDNINKVVENISQQNVSRIQDKINLNNRVTNYFGSLRRELGELKNAASKFNNYINTASNLFEDSYNVLNSVDFNGTVNKATNSQITYQVIAGDSLWKIANSYGISVAELKASNNLKSNLIHPGDTLIIPNHEPNRINPGDQPNMPNNEPNTDDNQSAIEPIKNEEPANKPQPDIPDKEANSEPELPSIPNPAPSGEYNGKLEYDAPYNIIKPHLTRRGGVYNYNGRKETWYSQEVLPGGGLHELNNNGRHVASDGTIRDGDGYIALAADLSIYPKGTVVLTSLGPGKVYDTGVSGQHIDIYVSTKNGWK